MSAAHTVTAQLTVLAASTSAATYVAMALDRRGRRPWPRRRTVLFVVGTAALCLAQSPWLDVRADRHFGVHMVQHLLLGMAAPIALVLAAPVTLLLRALPHRHARRLGRALRSWPVHLLTRPSIALLLSSGGLVALYLTPIYELSTRSSIVHLGVHAHVLLAGLLFAWVVAGPDPAPGRPSVRARLVILGVSIVVHATVAQLLYAGLLVRVDEPAAEMRAAGSLMYYAGDVLQLLLALALLGTVRSRAVRRRTALAAPHRAPTGTARPTSSR